MMSQIKKDEENGNSHAFMQIHNYPSMHNVFAREYDFV
jgi:hypothetical protein